MKKLIATTAIVSTVAGTALIGPADAATKRVRATDNRFTPTTLVVRRGDTVQWTFAGRRPHNVTGRSLRSGTKRRGTYRKRFTRRGTYRYVCTLHGGMRGTVRVR